MIPLKPLGILACLAISALSPSAWAGPPPSDAADERCLAFGWDPAKPPAPPPIAGPIVSDLSPDGSLQAAADLVRTTLSNDLDLAGAFRRLPAAAVPQTGAILWNSDEAFDYIGWADVGAFLVITGSVAPSPAGLVVRLDAWLTEEGDRLRLPAAEAEVTLDRAPDLVHRWVNHLLRCITTVPGAFGTRIAYARRLAAGQPKEIWVAEFGSAVQAQVSHDGQGALLPAWAPGGLLAWSGYRAGNPDVYVDGVPFSSRPGMNTGIAFSPDGRIAALTLAPDGNPDIYLVDAATGAELARLTSGRCIDTSPAWSPDGGRIAFVSDRAGGPQIYLMNPDGTEPRALPLPGDYNTSPDWSPDGTHIAYQSRGTGDRFVIWTVDVRTGDARPLTFGRTNDEEPSWSPDGRRIVYTSAKRGGRKALWVMDRDGSHARPLFEDAGDYFTPAWEHQFLVPSPQAPSGIGPAFLEAGRLARVATCLHGPDGEIGPVAPRRLHASPRPR